MQRLYVDETKARGYVLVAGALLPSDAGAIRKVVRALIAPGQYRVHMKAEKTPRQHLILSTLVELGVRAIVYEADSQRHRTDIARRHACLERLVHDAAGGVEHLVLESDSSQDGRDRQDLIEFTRAAGCRESLTYEHVTAAAEPLLAVPDAIAWAWARGGAWRGRVEPLIDRVVRV